MSIWKLIRHVYGDEEFTLYEGKEVSVGRGIENSVVLSSIVVSRKHCVITVGKNQIFIKDLKSSNGVYVGQHKIPPDEPFPVNNNEIIGFGWTNGAPLARINNNEKYVFKLQKVQCSPSIVDQIKFETEYSDIEPNIKLQTPSNQANTNRFPKAQKRKNEESLNGDVKEEIQLKINRKNDEEITNDDEQIVPTNSKYAEVIDVDYPMQENINFEAYNIKQEYIDEYKDELIEISDDSDSDMNWCRKLSQNSFNKHLAKDKSDSKPEEDQQNISYSQQDDCYFNDLFDENNEEIFLDDIIIIPESPIPLTTVAEPENNKCLKTREKETDHIDNSTNLVDQCLDTKINNTNISDLHESVKGQVKNAETSTNVQKKLDHKIKLIEPQPQVKRKKSTSCAIVIDTKKDSKISQDNIKRSTQKSDSKSVKEKRRKKLREIAEKKKEVNYKDESSTKQNESKNPSDNLSSTTYVKHTATNRSAFLTEPVHKDKQVTNKGKEKKVSLENKTEKQNEQQPKGETKSITNDVVDGLPNEKKHLGNESRHCKKSLESSETKSEKNTKPIRNSRDDKENQRTIPHSSNSLTQKKTKKSVRFSDAAPIVYHIEIAPGNQMKATKFAKTYKIDIKQRPRFPLDKINLFKILRWLPVWFQQQHNFNFPPPILGENKTLVPIIHKFENHKQYVKMIGDLILVEIWECLTLAYSKLDNKNSDMEMRIQSVPPPPATNITCDFFNISVDYKVPSAEIKNVPKTGEIVITGLLNSTLDDQRFFFVQDVRQIPLHSNNSHAFFSISLQGKYSDKTSVLKQGDIITVKPLTSITKELLLFEAIEYLRSSPLCDTLLNPEPAHFDTVESNDAVDMNAQWMRTLNHSQQRAVCESVSSAFSQQPSLQMIQGPPGTGKSSVICAIVKSYFYDAQSRKQSNRGKLLICATSNAAVDELVIRLLNIRQKLPKTERFAMVRVGRAEAMHPRAQLVSSQQLALREGGRLDPHAHTPAVAQEVAILEAKINMWKISMESAKDKGRIAYCQGRINEFSKKIQMMQGGARAPRSDVERQIIEGADVIVTTLGSALNHKMRGLKGRIALCIIDEAGQAIEPEALIPLALDVTHVSLIGDPQQLPGYICSQQAREHGLGESLFSRMTSLSEQWARSPVVLLDRQYRMHPAIVDYPNRAFYDARVRTEYAPRPALPLPPYCILAVAGHDHAAQNVIGRNDAEARGVSRLVVALTRVTRERGLTLAVITPYNLQKDLIKENIKRLQGRNDEAEVEVNTVDSFQGQERDVVVVSVARTHGVGFLSHAGRTNVMLTRARHALLVCIDPDATRNNPQWRSLIEDARQRNMFRELPHFMSHPRTSQSIPDSQISQILKWLECT